MNKVQKKIFNFVQGTNSCLLEKNIQTHQKKTERRILNVKRGGLQSDYKAFGGLKTTWTVAM